MGIVAECPADVVRLPRRIFASSDPEKIDLRIAFTDSEVAYAESTIGSMSTYADLIKQAGPGGVLFGAAEHDCPDTKWGYAIQKVEQAQQEIERIDNLCKAVYASAPPPNIRKILEAVLQEAREGLTYWTNHIEDNMKDIRVAVRRAHLLLRNYDLRIELYGKTHLGKLSKTEKERRKDATCESCGQKNHWQVDHVKWTCKHCKRYAPNHYANDCPSKPQKPRRSPRNHKVKKEMPSLMEVDEDWKFDSGWNDDGDVQNEDEGNGWD